MRQWTVQELNDQHPWSNLQLLDVRELWEYQIAAIHPSIHISLGQVVSGNFSLPKDKSVVVICHHGIRSAQACYLLERQGYDTINLTGGIDQWARAIDPTMVTY